MIQVIKRGQSPHTRTTNQAQVRQTVAKWKELFEPYGVMIFQAGRGGSDVAPLIAKGYTVAGLIPNGQRYFDIHHTAEDTIDKVNPRELQLGAAAMASLVYLVDQHGL